MFLSVVRKNLRAVNNNFSLARFLSVLSTVVLVVQDEYVLSESKFVSRKLVKTAEFAWNNLLNLDFLNSSCSIAEVWICQLTRRVCRNGLRVSRNSVDWTRWLGHGEVAQWIHRHFHNALYAIFRITVFTDIWILKSDLMMMICVF